MRCVWDEVSEDSVGVDGIRFKLELLCISLRAAAGGETER